MYTRNVPFKDYNNKPRNVQVQFMLEAKDVFKNYIELNAIFNWRDEISDQDRELDPQEMVDFFNNFESVLLAAWGEVKNDGLEFDRTGRYNFEQSKCFSAFMDMLLSDVTEVNKVLSEMMPSGMEEIVRKQAASLEKLKDDASNATDPEEREALQQRLAALEAQLKKGEPGAIE